jgi:hypothetical protein
MNDDSSHLTLEEILAAARELNHSAFRHLWRVALEVLAWGAIVSIAFLCATWSWSFIEPIKSTRVYWAVGVFSFLFFGSWPLIDFLRAFLVHRGTRAALEARVRAGENVPRPNPTVHSDLREKPRKSGDLHVGRSMTLSKIQSELLQIITDGVIRHSASSVDYVSEWLGHLPFGQYQWIECNGHDITKGLSASWDRDDVHALEEAGHLTQVTQWQAPDDECNIKLTFTVQNRHN